MSSVLAKVQHDLRLYLLAPFLKQRAVDDSGEHLFNASWRIKSIVILMLCNITGGNAKAYGKSSVNLLRKNS